MIETTDDEKLTKFRRFTETGRLATLEPLLPLMLNLKGNPYTLRDHFPFAPIFRTRKPETLVFRCGRQVSKTCRVAGPQKVLLADGRRVAGHEIRAGDVVTAMDDRRLMVPARVLDAVRVDGKPTFRVITGAGNVLDIADTHPLLKLEGWSRCDAIRVGDRVAVARRAGVFGSRSVETAKIVITAYLLGDGGRVDGELDELARVEAANDDLGEWLEGEVRARLSRGERARDRSIPAWVYSLTRADTALFLSRLWSADRDPAAESLAYASMSRELAYDVRSLLLKFGIPSSVSRPEPYVVRVETRDGRRRFLAEIADPTWPLAAIEDDEVDDLDTLSTGDRGPLAEVAGAGRVIARDELRGLLDAFAIAEPGHPRLRELADLLDGDVLWDEVESITPMGVGPCWDIEVQGHHNYLLDGVVSHNSTSLASEGLVFAAAQPFTTTLFVTPLFEQIRRFSVNYVGAFLKHSPVPGLWLDSKSSNNVLQRDFKNSSKLVFSFASLSADRTRGLDCDRVNYDELQNLDHDHIPIIAETMSYSKWGISQFTGTPLSADNGLEMYWLRSSMAEWVIPCHGCPSPTHRNGITWNIPSADRHILAMIGPMRDDISDDRPAVVCHRCRRSINPRQGHWEHAKPELRWTHAGYHVPQIIMPEHYGKPAKWGRLLAKQRDMAPNLFFNEVLGEAYDVGSKLVNVSDLKRAACLGFPNRPVEPDERMLKRLPEYRTLVLGIDWGGGRRVAGKEETSYTVMALMGLTADGLIDVLWGRRLLTPHDHLAEAEQVRRVVSRFNPTLVAHDYTGAGSLRETFLVQSGMSIDRLVPVAYCASARRGIMTHIPASDVHPRDHYQMDKTRSLQYTTSALKLGKIRTFEYDNQGSQSPGLLHDFLALVDEKSETGVGEVYKIVRQPGFSDDFAHAVNIGVNSIWATNGYPDFAGLYGHQNN